MSQVISQVTSSKERNWPVSYKAQEALKHPFKSKLAAKRPAQEGSGEFVDHSGFFLPRTRVPLCLNDSVQLLPYFGIYFFFGHKKGKLMKVFLCHYIGQP